MTYYNNSHIIFTRNPLADCEGDLESRTATQSLPAGAIPVAIINGNTGHVIEIQNTPGLTEVFAFCQENEIDYDGFEVVES